MGLEVINIVLNEYFVLRIKLVFLWVKILWKGGYCNLFERLVKYIEN